MQVRGSQAGHDLVHNGPQTSQYNHAGHQTNIDVQTFVMVMVFPENSNPVMCFSKDHRSQTHALKIVHTRIRCV